MVHSRRTQLSCQRLNPAVEQFEDRRVLAERDLKHAVAETPAHFIIMSNSPGQCRLFDPAQAVDRTNHR